MLIVVTARRRHKLQWGHAEHSVEDAMVDRVMSTAGCWLQWGHAEHSVEDLARDDVDGDGARASMGPR